MKCHILYLIADFENFSPDTLKLASVNEGLSIFLIGLSLLCHEYLSLSCI